MSLPLLSACNLHSLTPLFFASLRAGSLVGRVSLAKELARGMGRGKVSLHASY